MYNLMNFDNLMHLCNHYLNEDIEHFHYLRKFFHVPLKSIPTPSKQYCSNFYYHGLTLLELHINKIIMQMQSYAFLFTWITLLNILLLRFTCYVAYISSPIFNDWEVFHYMDISTLIYSTTFIKNWLFQF